ncbi:MAG: hypothetical protein H7327_05020 [Herminiimonas sp.]|nr:hypothetical protein [Herminiimonas sp.]
MPPLGEFGAGTGIPDVPEGTPKVLDPPVELPLLPELLELSGIVAPEEPGMLDEPDDPEPLVP